MASELDFVETLNSRVVAGADNRRARRFAQERGLLQTASRNAHSLFELGRAYVEMDAFEGSDDFLQSMASGRIEGSASPFWVHFCGIYAEACRKQRGD